MDLIELVERAQVASLCSICPEPGYCCRAIRLNGGSFPESELIDEAEYELKDEYGYPFRPLFIENNDYHVGWVLWCTELGFDGRCNNYANRPFACQAYKPGQDRFCIFDGRHQVIP